MIDLKQTAIERENAEANLRRTGERLHRVARAVIEPSLQRRR